LNGVRLDRSDITATNGTSVVLAACTTGDIIHIQATKAFLASDSVSASAGGTFASAVTMTSPLAVASGGSGAATHTANGVLLGAGTGAMTTAAPGSSGNVLTSNGTVWASTAAAGGGKIGQVLQTHKTDRSAITSTETNSYAAISGLTQAITCAATSSKVLILGYVSFHLVPTANGTIHFGIFRDSTQVGQGAADANRNPSTVSFRSPADAADWYTYGIISQSFQFLDSPSSTSEIVYSIKASAGATYTSTIIFNGSDDTTGGSQLDYQPASSCGITCMEVLA
jgi:hypothetical protein